MTEEAIRSRLVERGQSIFAAPKGPIAFTRFPEANDLLNDLDRYPHAFVIACLMDRQIKAEKAWIIPYIISTKIGGFSMRALKQLSQYDIKILMSKPNNLHRYNSMSNLLWLAIQKIAKEYNDDASRIWTGHPSSATVIYRFLQFKGIGPKIANMATNILAREFKIPFSDYRPVDISADVHVRRVFARLGLCSSAAKTEEIVDKARSLHPDFPGLMDLPSWQIGTTWCKPRNPACSDCYMNDLCPTAALGDHVGIIPEKTATAHGTSGKRDTYKN